MKIFIFLILFVFNIFEPEIFGKDKVTIEKDIYNLILDWGYLENFHPAIISCYVDGDSLFSIVADKIINLNEKYSLQDLLVYLNSNTPGLTWIDWDIYQRTVHKNSLKEYLQQLLINNTKFENTRVVFDESVGQLKFKSFAHTKNPFPSSGMRILALAKIWNNYKFFYPYQDILPKDKHYKTLLKKYITKFLASKNYSNYHLTVLQFISEYRDSHSNATSFFFYTIPRPVPWYG